MVITVKKQWNQFMQTFKNMDKIQSTPQDSEYENPLLKSVHEYNNKHV